MAGSTACPLDQFVLSQQVRFVAKMEQGASFAAQAAYDNAGGYLGVQRSVWKVLNAEEDERDPVGARLLNRVYQIATVVMIVLVILIDFSGSTNPFFLDFVRFAFLCFTAEYALKLWSCVQADGAHTEPDTMKVRKEWAMQLMSLLDLINLVAYWGTAMMPMQARGARLRERCFGRPSSHSLSRPFFRRARSRSSACCGSRRSSTSARLAIRWSRATRHPRRRPRSSRTKRVCRHR